MTRLMISARIAPYSETPALAIRNGIDVADFSCMMTESYGPSAFLNGGRNATVQYGHDSDDIGQVIVVAGVDAWYHADMVVETDDPQVIERCKVGTPVSIGARILTRCTYSDLELRIRRHGLAQLEHVAISRPGEHPGYRGAKIVSVTEAKATREQSPAAGIDWRSQLPHEYRDFADLSIDLKPGEELTIGRATRGIRWNGVSFEKPYARAA